MDDFKHIGLVGRLGSNSVIHSLKLLVPFLAERGISVILEEKIAQMLPGHGLQVCSTTQMGEFCDLVIVVGGDGSLLGAARDLADHDVPVLGINRGNLGFLTDIAPGEIEEKVTEVLGGMYRVEERFLVDAQVHREGNLIGEGAALNDVILHPGKSASMISFELYIEGQFVYSQRSDGLIVSTPTGSTAYALSGGGPIMHPKLDALVLVPMFPHTLSSRPIVVDGGSELKIVIGERNKTWPHVSCDGQVHIACAPADTVTIRKKPRVLRLIHPLNHNFYETCRTKLGWGTKLGD